MKTKINIDIEPVFEGDLSHYENLGTKIKPSFFIEFQNHSWKKEDGKGLTSEVHFEFNNEKELDEFIEYLQSLKKSKE